MKNPRLLELFCGAQGESRSWAYHRVGFEVVGVDIKPQPRYPFELHQADALRALEILIDRRMGRGTMARWPTVQFDANLPARSLGCGPPCQRYSDLAKSRTAPCRALGAEFAKGDRRVGTPQYSDLGDPRRLAARRCATRTFEVRWRPRASRVAGRGTQLGLWLRC